MAYVSDETSNEHATANEQNQLEHKRICATYVGNQFQTFCENISNWMLPIERDPWIRNKFNYLVFFSFNIIIQYYKPHRCTHIK